MLHGTPGDATEAASDEGDFAFHEAPTLRLGRRPLAEGERPLILIADDNVDAQLIYGECFTTLGYRVAVAMDGAAAVDLARKLVPDVIIMDLAMPEIEGTEATRILKADASTRACAVIVVTAQGTAAFPDAHAAGCDAFFCKPLDPYSLDDVIRTLLPDGHAAAKPLAEADASSVYKTCACGRSYSRTEWNDLRLCGYMGATQDGELLEIRNCVCGSTIAVSAPWGPSVDRLVRH